MGRELARLMAGCTVFEAFFCSVQGVIDSYWRPSISKIARRSASGHLSHLLLMLLMEVGACVFSTASLARPRALVDFQKADVTEDSRTIVSSRKPYNIADNNSVEHPVHARRLGRWTSVIFPLASESARSFSRWSRHVGTLYVRLFHQRSYDAERNKDFQIPGGHYGTHSVCLGCKRRSPEPGPSWAISLSASPEVRELPCRCH